MSLYGFRCLNPSVIMSVKAFTKNYTSSYFFFIFLISFYFEGDLPTDLTMKSIRSINITLKYWYIFSVNNFVCIRRFSGRDRQETNILVIILFVFIDYHVGIDRKQTYCRHNVRTVSTIHSFSRYIYIYIYICVCVCVKSQECPKLLS